MVYLKEVAQIASIILIFSQVQPSHLSDVANIQQQSLDSNYLLGGVPGTSEMNVANQHQQQIEQPISKNMERAESDERNQNQVGLETDSLKRIFFKDLDLDGYVQRQAAGDQWKLIKLDQLLEALSNSLTPPMTDQIYRTGRTYPTAGVSIDPPVTRQSYNRYISQRPHGNLRKLSKQQNDPQGNSIIESSGSSIKVKTAPLIGILWPPEKNRNLLVQSGGYVNSRRSLANPHHPIGTEEIAIHTPLHSRSLSDYEWKRVENSRWNNLRGMWGKRSVPASTKSNIDD